MTFYSDMAVTASNLIADKGQTVTFSYTSGATFDPVLGQDSGGTPTSFTANAVALNYSKMEIDGTVIQRGDVKLIVEQTSTDIAVDMKCTVDSVDYRVMNVEPIDPAGTLVISKVQLRV